MPNFVYLAQRHSHEFSCEPNFGGGGVPPGCASAPLAPLNPPMVHNYWSITIASGHCVVQLTWNVGVLRVFAASREMYE